MSIPIRIKRKVAIINHKKINLLDSFMEDRDDILNRIRKRWEILIHKSFKSQGAVDQYGNIHDWKPLSKKYRMYKEGELERGYRQKRVEYLKTKGKSMPSSTISKYKKMISNAGRILERSHPTLESRYIKGIHFIKSGFGLEIKYPMLKGRGNNNKVDAGIHMYGSDYLPKRPLYKTAFIKEGREVINEEIDKLIDKTSK